MSNEVEILRDLPLLNEKITQCEKTKLDFERAIIKEETAMMELQGLITQCEYEFLAGRRQSFDIASLNENIHRHRMNISLFYASIDKEDAAIAKMKNIIDVLRQDLIRPNEVIFDMRVKPQFRN